jgi:hypothetical protein
VVAGQLWEIISSLFARNIGSDFESVTRWWISENKNSVLNIFSSAVMWVLWTVRNERCFQGLKWPGVKVLVSKLWATIRSWKPLCMDKHSSLLEDNILLLDHHRGELLRIAWT